VHAGIHGTGSALNSIALEGSVGLNNIVGPLTPQQIMALITKWVKKDPALIGNNAVRYLRFKMSV
jgi:hypothetical protein